MQKLHLFNCNLSKAVWTTKRCGCVLWLKPHSYVVVVGKKSERSRPYSPHGKVGYKYLQPLHPGCVLWLSYTFHSHRFHTVFVTPMRTGHHRSRRHESAKVTFSCCDPWSCCAESQYLTEKSLFRWSFLSAFSVLHPRSSFPVCFHTVCHI